MVELKDLLYRETDDATATPIFVVFKRCTSVSEGAIKYISIDNMPEDFEVYFTSDSINLKELASKYDYDRVVEYFEENGYKCHIDDDFNISYWSEEDETRADTIQNAFWTREEANNWCNSNKYNGDFYSYSIRAIGVLAEAMKQTCKREIDRNKANK